MIAAEAPHRERGEAISCRLRLVPTRLPRRLGSPEWRRGAMIPGELFVADGDIELNAGRPTVTLTVANTGDRPIQVGSHYHFYETNSALAVRPRQGARLPARHPGRHRDPVRAGAEPRGAAGRLCRGAAGRRVQRPRQRGALTWRTQSAAAPMPPCSGRPPATACASPTPSSSSRSRATARSMARRSSSAAAR